MATFVFDLVYAMFALSETNQEKKVLNVPIMTISCGEIALMVISGCVCMSIPNLPNWVGIVVCNVILVLTIISVILVKEVGENTASANRNLNNATYRFRDLFETSQLVVSKAKSDDIKRIAQRVSDSIRYSYPVSTDITQSLETEIENKLTELEFVISDGE